MPKPTENRATPVEQGQTASYEQPQGCLLRLFWMAFGNLALLGLALGILEQDGFSLFDIAYWMVVAALGGARYADIVRFRGLTVHGEPATIRHFRRYVLGLLLLAAGLWIATHILQRLL